MRKNIQDLLTSVVKSALKELQRANLPEEDLYLDIPADSRFGDFTSNIALRLSKTMRKSPRDVAQELLPLVDSCIQKSPLKNHIKEIKIEGAGFINFYFKEEYFYEELRKLLIQGKRALRVDIGKGRRTLVEFVSANPTGPLSVAHARQAAVGDSLANILDFIGFRVKREYYLNDEGNQINILGNSTELRLRELNGEKIEFPENYYQGDYIYDIAKKVQSLKQKPQDLGDFAGNYILDIIKKELDDFGVHFNCWYSQKALRKSGKIDKTLKFLKKKGFLYEQDGALWFRSTQFGDDKDRVVIKSDKSFTYLAPDIAYHREKYRRGFSWLINLWGPDHHGYISRLKASVCALGHKGDSLSVVIVQLATIFRDGNTIEMSTRKGQYITLREVLNEVGLDASRFFFLMRRTDSHLDFDLSIAKKHTPENPVFYVQYAHARICSILRSSTKKINFKRVNLSGLKEKEELSLLKKILQFPYILNICYRTTDSYMLTVYLQALAEAFHKFYDLHRVLGENEELTLARLSLIDGVRLSLATGLELLGVSSPQTM